MAKGNLILGTAARSVGDITLYRREGVQVARVRVRDIANPKTTQQSAQRNFLAPVAKFYSPLATVLERSYEGLNKAKSYNAFLKKNIDLARSNGWYLPKGTPFFPLPYQVSRGSLQPLAPSFVSDYEEGGIMLLGVGSAVEAPTTIGALSSLYIGEGYKAGDVITFIAVLKSDEGDYYPQAAQFVISADDTTPIANACPLGCYITVNAGRLMLISNSNTFAAGCAIVARYDNGAWKRSTQTMVVDPTIVANLESESQRLSAIASYGNSSTSSDGNVYLDGDGTAFNVAAADGSALLFIGGTANVQSVTADGHTFVAIAPTNRGAHYFVKKGSQYLTMADDSTAASGWTFTANVPSTATASNTIEMTQGDAMQSYLMTLGVPSSVF